MKTFRTGFSLLVVSFIFLITTTPATSYAESALGVVLGDPTGLSGRHSIGDQRSLEGALAFSSGKYEGLHVHGTYIWDDARTIRLQKGGVIEMYYGLGLRVITINAGKYDGDTAIGPRAPIGLLYNINNPNIEIFGELSAAVDLAPRTDVDIDAGIGVRIRF